MNIRMFAHFGALVLLVALASADPQPQLAFPNGVTFGSASPQQMREAMRESVTQAGVPGGRSLIPGAFQQLDCKENRKAAALTEGYLAAAPQDFEFFVRRIAFEKPCFASLVAATAAGQIPAQRDLIVAAVKAGVADSRATGDSDKNPVGKNPELVGATDKSIDLSGAAGERNGPVDSWLWELIVSRPYFAMDGSINPGVMVGRRRAAEPEPERAGRPRRPPRGAGARRDVSPSFPQ